MEDGQQPEVEQEVISKYEQEPEFRNFIKNLLRCRSLASLDDNKEVKREEEEEKTARTEKKSDDIERRIVGRGRYQEKRRNHQALLSEGGRTEERSGRGEPGDSAVSHNLPIKFLPAAVNLEIFIISKAVT